LIVSFIFPPRPTECQVFFFCDRLPLLFREPNCRSLWFAAASSNVPPVRVFLTFWVELTRPPLGPSKSFVQFPLVSKSPFSPWVSFVLQSRPHRNTLGSFFVPPPPPHGDLEFRFSSSHDSFHIAPLHVGTPTSRSSCSREAVRLSVFSSPSFSLQLSPSTSTFHFFNPCPPPPVRLNSILFYFCTQFP